MEGKEFCREKPFKATEEIPELLFSDSYNPKTKNDLPLGKEVAKYAVRGLVLARGPNNFDYQYRYAPASFLRPDKGVECQMDLLRSSLTALKRMAREKVEREGFHDTGYILFSLGVKKDERIKTEAERLTKIIAATNKALRDNLGGLSTDLPKGERAKQTGAETERAIQSPSPVNEDELEKRLKKLFTGKLTKEKEAAIEDEFSIRDIEREEGENSRRISQRGEELRKPANALFHEELELGVRAGEHESKVATAETQKERDRHLSAAVELRRRQKC